MAFVPAELAERPGVRGLTCGFEFYEDMPGLRTDSARFGPSTASTQSADPQLWPRCRATRHSAFSRPADRLLRERARIAAVLADLPAIVGS